MILKEYDCPSCGTFSALVPICTRCGKTAKRAGLKEIMGSGRPPGYASGVARRTDKILEREFADRGITNFTNAGGVSRPTFAAAKFPGVYASQMGDAPNQMPIQAGNINDLSQLSRMGIDPSRMTVEGSPWSPPRAEAMQAPVNGSLGPRANDLLSNREVIGRTDSNGNQVG